VLSQGRGDARVQRGPYLIVRGAGAGGSCPDRLWFWMYFAPTLEETYPGKGRFGMRMLPASMWRVLRGFALVSND